MLTLLPPIGKLDITGGSKGNICCEMNASEDGERPENDAHFTVQPLVRPQSGKTSSSDHPCNLERPSMSHSGLNTERGFVNENLDQQKSDEYSSNNFTAAETRGWKSCHESVEDMLTVDSPGQAEKILDENETACERAAERQTDYDQGQPQKLSFEDELTFIPKLNALSLKIAQSRTSVAKRIKVSCESRVAALEEEMAQNFTFRPCISENSLKIADRLKTDFWTRQRMHTEKQRKMLESAPSTWHPKAKLNSMPKQSMNLADNNFKEKTLAPTFSEPINPKSEPSASWTPDTRRETTENTFNTYPKMTAKFFHKHKKTAFQEMPPKRLESLKPRALKKLEQRKLKSEKIQQSLDDTATIHMKKECISEPGSPSKFSINVNSLETSTNENDRLQMDKTNKSKGVHKRSKTMPSNQIQIIHRPLVVDPDRFLKTKNSAEEALRNKKVFICMGPYPVLRACLRRRGWIEKYFKADIVCSNLAKDRSPDKFSRDSDDDDDDDEVSEGLSNGSPNSLKGESPRKHVENTSDKTAAFKSVKTLKWGQGDSGNSNGSRPGFDKKIVETKSRYAYGSTTLGNFEDLDQGFESDSQYGIMSRIARNAVPTLIWTCRRSDIEFNYLNKDQIVNHFAHASSFTTKFGLCINIRNVPWFESIDPDSFFPRCHRLSSDNERQDFIDEFRMLSAISILRHTVKRLNGDDKLTVTSNSDKLVPVRALLLAIKACQGYLKSKDHLDIQEEQLLELYGLSEQTWNQIIEFFYQLTRSNGMIIGAESHKEECEELLMKMEEAYPQSSLHDKNIWIVKPGAKSRGRGILVMNNLEEILRLSSYNPNIVKRENRWVIQKYIERPLLIYNTKFDIRQWFLVTDWNPFTLWFYKDSYLRFCSQEFTLSKFDPEYHLANNSIQKDYANGQRSKHLPSDNMWTKDQYITYLREHGQGDFWDDVIYPSMKQSIIYTLLACQDSLEYRKNSFELYGADFMLSEDMKPWLIEINCSPAMGPSTAITEKLCAEVIEDTLKVVLDRKENKSCDTGKFELAFKQPYIPIPVYTGSNLLIEGEGYKKSMQFTSPQHSTIKIQRNTKLRDTKESRDNEETGPKKLTMTFSSPRAAKMSQEKAACDIDDPTGSTKIIKDEIKNLILKDKKENTWQGCLCGSGEKCQVVSAYHVQNASLEVTTDEPGTRHTGDGCSPRRLSKQTLKLARMHRKAKKKIAYATFKYKKAGDGPGLSISPGHGVTQI